jgi:hypothetical protein
MTDAQMYLAIGLPSVVALIGILINVGYFVAINSRMSGQDNRFTSLESKQDRHYEVILGKVEDIDVRLARLEEWAKQR